MYCLFVFILCAYLHNNRLVITGTAHEPSVGKHKSKKGSHPRSLSRPHDKLVYGCALLGIQDGIHEILHKTDLRVAQHNVVHKLEHQVPGVIYQLSPSFGRLHEFKEKDMRQRRGNRKRLIEILDA